MKCVKQMNRENRRNIRPKATRGSHREKERELYATLLSVETRIDHIPRCCGFKSQAPGGRSPRLSDIWCPNSTTNCFPSRSFTSGEAIQTLVENAERDDVRYTRVCVKSKASISPLSLFPSAVHDRRWRDFAISLVCATFTHDELLLRHNFQKFPFFPGVFTYPPFRVAFCLHRRWREGKGRLS